MVIRISAPRGHELRPRIVVFGVGGAGGNAVNNMIDSGLQGVDFVAANTDAQQLQFSRTASRIQLGVEVTQGLGAGAHPEVGKLAAEATLDAIGRHLEGAHIVFITAGMGGGTGTGAAPIIARCAHERGILTVGVVTKPFIFEGRHRMRLAEGGISELQRYADTLIVIPNQNLFRIATERTTFAEAFSMADQILLAGVRSITDLMTLPGLINLDFADVRSVMSRMGKAMMGSGEASGEDRAFRAALDAIENPLLDDSSLKGAKAVLVNVTGGLDMTLHEVDEAANIVSVEVDPDANIIFGAAFDPTLDGTIRVSVVATGLDSALMAELQKSLRTSTTPDPTFGLGYPRDDQRSAPPSAPRLRIVRNVDTADDRKTYDQLQRAENPAVRTDRRPEAALPPTTKAQVAPHRSFWRALFPKRDLKEALPSVTEPPVELKTVNVTTKTGRNAIPNLGSEAQKPTPAEDYGFPRFASRRNAVADSNLNIAVPDVFEQKLASIFNNIVSALGESQISKACLSIVDSICEDSDVVKAKYTYDALVEMAKGDDLDLDILAAVNFLSSSGIRILQAHLVTDGGRSGPSGPEMGAIESDALLYPYFTPGEKIMDLILHRDAEFEPRRNVS